jgi:glycosyltransferase involved in cell wall biosynthesis
MEEAEMSPLFAANDEACAMADAVICASTFTRSSLAAAGSGPAPAHVVGYGVDLDVFTARSAAPAAKPLTVGFVGALSQRKGACYLLGATSRFAEGRRPADPVHPRGDRPRPHPRVRVRRRRAP